MFEIEYLMMLRSHLQATRVVCGVSKDESGRTIVTTCEPRHYGDGVTKYTNERTESYDDYVASQFQIGYKK